MAQNQAIHCIQRVFCVSISVGNNRLFAILGSLCPKFTVYIYKPLHV